MSVLSTVEDAIPVAEAIINEIVKIAPAISQGIADATPYVQALAGLLSGSNATQQDIDDLLTQLQADSARFQQPLPPDDGTTTT